MRGRRRAPRDHRHDAGRARLPRHDPREPAPGPARPGPARPGPARPGPARPDATQADPREAASSARLLDWIDSLPDGWVTMLGGGAALSGGRRGRLLLARALLANPPVLVLDEPTEGLDPDAAVLADILDATRGRTTLLVTHERSGLAAADRVVTLDRGRIRPVPECTR
ncbi:ABC-type transport system involved in cytochrome bd biosynthesis fused ATPase/permease subunit [Streptomyces phaeochromogenes]|uniref:ATP-binding cassette domain-containing protein n=1 Tax=Streptomyces phaeochromogenes TaxID=1923 RepID=UPI00278FC863|nr:ATP-binding cassette domain-containing protein [Streptomyces phaeochromogenes]MDQ0955810.1 ABC-type transport system involved in cytochrome bd biosynthesis fused ATPase/permease subunit [Streptomyces phaeochromogenes]